MTRSTFTAASTEDQEDGVIGLVVPLDPDETPARVERELRLSGPSDMKLLIEFQSEPRQADGSPLPISPGFVRRLGSASELGRLAVVLAKRGAAAVAYGCTSCSFIGGRVFAEKQASRMARAARVPATSTSLGLVAALQTLGVTNISMASPYVRAINDRLIAFLTEHGVSVAKTSFLGLETGHATTPVRDIVDAAHTAASSDSEALFIACTGQKVASELDTLERETGRPVLTANQVTLWHALTLAGALVERGPGALYDARSGRL